MPRHRGVRQRAAHVLRRARLRQRRQRVPRLARLASLVVVVLAGVMIAVSARLSDGGELRPTRNTDLADLVRSQARRNVQLTGQAAQLQRQIDQLSAEAGQGDGSRAGLDKASATAGLTAVKGPAVRVTLTDAPLTVQPIGVDEDLLVVHQQDIQMVVNVLWAGGAEAMTIQGQRVVSTTGIKCVGNTVVLHGVPYAPPYVVTAIGDPARLEAALATSKEVAVYQQYVRAYHLGWKDESLATVTMPGYRGSLDLAQASAGPR